MSSIATEVRTDNMESMLRNILDKVSKLDELCKKVDVISQRAENIEANLERLDTRLSDLENGVGFLETDVSEIKHDIEEIRATKTDFEYVNEIKRNVVDLVNRSKLNNVILHGIRLPEGEETTANGTQDCVTYAGNFFVTHLNVHEVEIERAHRTPRVKRPTANEGDRSRPRPIHVRQLRFNDREAILKRSSALKGVRIYPGLESRDQR